MSIFIGRLQKAIAKSIAAGPWFIGQRNVGTFLEAVALTLDSYGLSLQQGLRLAHPLDCDVSALPILSRDRRIALFPSEPVKSQRYRLSRWLQLHRQRGTHQGEMRNVQPYFLSGVLPMLRIVHQAGDGSSATWHTLHPNGTYSRHRATPSNWDFDGQPEKWARWWAIIYVTGTWIDEGETHWNDGSEWNGGQVWNGIAAQILVDLVAMLIDWKAAHSRCAGVILARDPQSFDPTATAVTLADGRTTLPTGGWHRLVDPTTGLPTRLNTAFFIHDRYRV